MNPPKLCLTCNKVWRTPRTVVALAFAYAAIGPLAVATPPTLDNLYPAGAALASSNTVVLAGKAEPWPARVWLDDDTGVHFLAQTNPGCFTVTIATDARPGPRLVRLFNDEGASDPRIFVVGDGREEPEIEPNNTPTTPQSVTNLPVTLNGRLDKSGDVDTFAVTLRAGQWLDARVDAYTLLSPLDAVLRLVTPQGVTLAWNHDFATLDPRLVWQAPADQTVVLQLFGFKHPADAAIQLAGAAAAVYRLHLSVSASHPDLPGAVRPASDANASAASALELPAVLNGTLAGDDDVDRYRFRAPTNAFVVARLDAESLGSPLDAWLRIEDEAGRELAQNDDAEGSCDPRIEWKAPTNGTYAVAVGSVTHRGGPAFRYRLSLQGAGPEYSAKSEASSIVLSAGATNELKFKITRRRGHTNELQASLPNLPAGVTAAPLVLPPGNADVILKLVATSNAAPFNGPMELLLADPAAHLEQSVPFELISQGENNGVPQGYSHLLVERTDRLWLTVRPQGVP